MAGKAKPGFSVAVFLAIAALIGMAVWRVGHEKTRQGDGEDIALPAQRNVFAEAPDTSDLTRVEEYELVASAKLPEVEKTSSYEAMDDDTVRFAINAWAGWAPIVYANEGSKLIADVNCDPSRAPCPGPLIPLQP